MFASLVSQALKVIRKTWKLILTTYIIQASLSGRTIVADSTNAVCTTTTPQRDCAGNTLSITQLLSRENFFPEQKETYEDIRALIRIEKIDKDEKVTKLSEFIREKICAALLATNNSRSIDRLMLGRLKIIIAPEKIMKAYSKADEFIGFYIPYKNEIYLHEEVFNDWNDNKSEQIITLLANEISHVSIRLNNQVKMSPTDKKSQIAANVPWKNEKEKKEFIEAYKEYSESIITYKKLISKNESGEKLSTKERLQLKKFDAALTSFIPPRLGLEAITAVESRVIATNDGGFTAIRMKVAVPSANEPEARLLYLRDAFFQTVQNAVILYEWQHRNRYGIYQNNDDQRWSDLISDFESISPAMRQAFGRSLCKLLDRFFNVENHCDRPWWPTIK